MRLMENAMPPAEGTISTERHGPLLLIGINRPAKRNGFTPRMFRELAQEREVLAIEVQHARGNVEAAKGRARAFVKTYPKSPHSAKLSRFFDE